jgi:hypothetical protein
MLKVPSNCTTRDGELLRNDAVGLATKQRVLNFLPPIVIANAAFPRLACLSGGFAERNFQTALPVLRTFIEAIVTRTLRHAALRVIARDEPTWDLSR